MVQFMEDIGRELSILMIKLGSKISLVSIYLDLIENHHSFFINILGIVVYSKTPYICVLSSKLLCFCAQSTTMLGIGWLELILKGLVKFLVGISIMYFTLLESYDNTTFGHNHWQHQQKLLETHGGILTLRQLGFKPIFVSWSYVDFLLLIFLSL